MNVTAQSHGSRLTASAVNRLEHVRAAEVHGQRLTHVPERGRDLRLLLGAALRRDQCILGLAALRDVTQRAGERRRPVALDAGDRELDGKHAAVGAHRGDLEARADDGPLAGREIVDQAAPVRLPERRRDDQRGHLAPERLRAGVAERALRGRVELRDPAAVVDGDDAVERGAEDRGTGPRTCA
jgi:hypothetical protein